MRCCVAHEYGNWCHDEATIDVKGKPFCVYHAPSDASEKPNGKEFYRLVQDRIRDEDNGCVFDGTIFPKSISLRSFEVNGTLSFERCQFEGNLSFYSSSVRGDLSFRGATFFKKVSIGEDVNTKSSTRTNGCYQTTQVPGGVQALVSLTIDGDVRFEDAIIHGSFTLKKFSNGGKINLSSIAATRRASLSKISTGELECENAYFQNVVRLLDVVIAGKADFNRAKFNAFATIIRCDFRDLVYFSSTEFNSRLRIRNSRFKETALFERTKLTEASFPLCHFGEHAVFSDVDLKAVSFARAPIESFYFVGCNWLQFKGRAITIDVLGLKSSRKYEKIPSPLPAVRSLPGKDQRNASAKKLGELYRRLKRLARIENDELLASDWHYLEKRC
jgi:hypothetical protein